MSEILLRNRGDQRESPKLLLELIEDSESQSKLLFDDREVDLMSCDLVNKLELLIGTSVSKRIELKLFNLIMNDCELSWDELYAQYVGKNVLNIFRQDHGYKHGTYKKIWNDREDNEHLVSILKCLDSKSPSFRTEIYESLKGAYPS